MNCFNSDTDSENGTLPSSTPSSNKTTSTKPTIPTDDSIKKKNSNKIYFSK